MRTIRRGRRTDIRACRAMLYPDAADTDFEQAEVRHWRRLAQDPAHDFYVAQSDDVLYGMVLVSYVRRLRQRGWQAILDIAVLPTAPDNIEKELIDFAKERARKRACLSIAWLPSKDDPLPPAWCGENGFQKVGEFWSCDLAEC